VESEAQRLAAGNTSVESSVRRLDGPDAVEAEVARIADESAQMTALTGLGRSRAADAPPEAGPGA